MFSQTIPTGLYARSRATKPKRGNVLKQPTKPHGGCCESNAHALDLMRQIQSAGGEGLVARKPGLVWRPGRTTEMLKIK